MKRLVLLLSSFLMVAQLLAQKTVNEYSYVVVPDQYDFTTGKDAFQINSMTNFMLNKYGFNSFMVSEVPNVKRCDGLFADVEKGKGFIGTKLSLILKDCNGNEIYRSPEGKSKLKDFKQAYQDALREAFQYVAAENFEQTEMIVFEQESSAIKNIETKKDSEIIKVEVKKSETKAIDNPNTIETKVEVTKEQEPNDETKTVTVTKTENKDVVAGIRSQLTPVDLMPTDRFSSYILKSKTFLLRKTTEGYSLYEETTGAGDGLLLIGTLTAENNMVTFIDSSGNKKEAYFDKEKNLNIIQEDGLSLVYKLVN